MKTITPCTLTPRRQRVKQETGTALGVAVTLAPLEVASEGL
jgi:hypothetical protein